MKITVRIDETARYAPVLLDFLEFVTRPQARDLRFWQALAEVEKLV